MTLKVQYKLEDWQIAEKAEGNMKTMYQLAEELSLDKMELFPYGHYVGKLDFMSILNRLESKPNGKYINVTAITPTPLGEGKSTTTIGLIQGLGKRNKKSGGAIRQPSGGPTFNIKGSAAGGGYAQCIPLTDFSLGLTGDIDAVTNAHNLAMVALTSRLQHEYNYSDDILHKKKLRRLDIDPNSVTVGWAIDFCAQALREIIIGIGGKMNGFTMKSGFQISVSSEVMAILAVAKDFQDLRKRIGRIALAYNKRGNPVTTEDLEVAGAMTALMSKALYPNLIQTIEGQPVLVHAGPFANIAIGQSSIIADRVGLKLADYHVTESGFGADIGFEKFCNIKSRISGLIPSCSVIVATIRSLKMHGGGPLVSPGKPLDKVYSERNTSLVEKGMENLFAHIEIVKKSGVIPVVCINHFYTDTDDETEIVRKAVESKGVRCSVSKHWELGGEGALDLADAVIDACKEKPVLKPFYDTSMPHKERIEKIAKEVYGATNVEFLPDCLEKIERIDKDESMKNYYTCMVKTQLSLSHDPSLKGRPHGWDLPVMDVKIFRGAEFIVPIAGKITLMPGTASDPAFRRIDIDVNNGKVTGLF